MLILFLGTAAIVSCDKESLTTPNPTLPVPNSTQQTTFPPASGPSRIFNFLIQSSYPVAGYTTRSRYALYDNGAFSLQYADNGGFEYRGGYTDVNGIITFKWEGWSTAGPWGATATLKGDTLTVAYNDIMLMSDFDNAVYLKKP